MMRLQLILVMAALSATIPALAQSNGGTAPRYFLVVPPQFLTVNPYTPPEPPPTPDHTWVMAGEFATLQECEASAPNVTVKIFEGTQQVTKVVPSDSVCEPLSFFAPAGAVGSD